MNYKILYTQWLKQAHQFPSSTENRRESPLGHISTYSYEHVVSARADNLFIRILCVESLKFSHRRDYLLSLHEQRLYAANVLGECASSVKLEVALVRDRQYEKVILALI